ncbi:MAG: C-GCAxxG-C-C family protein [Bacteroidota bacterium]
MGKANELFDMGYNCAQSMFYAYGKDFFENDGRVMKVASGFGGGISSMGETCGAVSGSLMALGLHFGPENAANKEQKEKLKEITSEFLTTFEEKHGSLKCRDLIGADMSTPEGAGYIRQHGVVEKVCPALIRSASEIMETLIQKHGAKKS